jgi:hypothetical protein
MQKVLLCALALVGVVGCDKAGDGAAKPDGSAKPATTTAASAKPSASASASAAATGDKCSALGCEPGTGTFFEKCDCKAKPPAVPLKAKYAGKRSSFFKQPEFEVTNTTDKPIHWGSVAIYYYDKAGKQLEAEIDGKKFAASRSNGSNFTLKPNETKTINLGFKSEHEPKNVDSMEVVFDGWCWGVYEDEASHVCVTIERPADVRARSGG